MSVMVGVKHAGRIAIAVDSLWVSDDVKSLRADPKLIRRSGMLLTVGPTSGYEQTLWDEITALASASNDWPRDWGFHCLAPTTISALQKLAVDDAPILVAWAGRLLKVWPGGSIFEDADGIEACGSGEPYARAAAFAFRDLRPDFTANTIAKRAALMACRFVTTCAPPIVVKSIAAD